MNISAKELTNLVNTLVDKRISSVMGPGWAYGEVIDAEWGGNDTPIICQVQLDGIESDIYNCICLEHVVAHIGDYVLTMPVNGYSGDRVVVGVIKSSFEHGTLLFPSFEFTIPSAITKSPPTALTWYNLTDMEYTFTPTVDSVALMFVHAVVAHSSANVWAGLRIQRINPSALTVALGYGISPVAAYYPTITTGCMQVLTAGIEYTFRCQVMWSIGGGGTVGSIPLADGSPLFIFLYFKGP
jgi:hypothetical protein